MHDFRQLSPLDFENLVRDLLQAELGIYIESFGPGADGGIDFRFAHAGKTTVIQVKHYIDSPSRALLKAARDENEKVALLRPSRYILATSTALTPALKDKLISALSNAPLKREDVFGKEDLNNLLERHPSVLRQHFKLWLTHTDILERILHSGIYNRTDAELDVIKSLVPKFVQNRSVAEAEAILEQRGALIIAGDPGVGKTTLARILTWLHLAQEWRVFVVDDLTEAMEICSKGEKRLIFFDDFLGQISLTNEVIRNTDQRLPIFLERVRCNKDLRFILTTRSYLLLQAQLQSTKLSSEKITASELILNVGSYTRGIRAQILFNHIYFSDLTNEEKRSLLSDDFYLRIIDHRNFSPRLIELLTSADFQSIQDLPIRDAVINALNNPSALWERPYRAHLSADSRTIMLALFFSGHWPSVDTILQAFKRFSHHIDDSQMVVSFRHALKPLEGSIVSLSNNYIFFSNPGIRDFMSAVIIEDHLLLSIVKSAGTFVELDNAWGFYIKHHDVCSKQFNDEIVWIDAVKRLMVSGRGAAIEHLRLALDMSEHLDEKYPTLALAEDAFKRLSVEGADPIDESECRHALELFQNLSLDEQQALPSNTVLAQVTADMLSGAGDTLSLDEIKEVASAIERYGEAPTLAKNAACDALHGFIECLENRLDDISSISELNSFEDELEFALSAFDLKIPSDSQLELNKHRDYLEEKEADRNDKDYKPSAPLGRDIDASDSEVRSLFAILQTQLLGD